MKIVHVSYSDIIGGAHRAAYRLHHALRRHDVDSLMYVSIANSGDWTVQGLGGGKRSRVWAMSRALLGGVTTYLMKSANSTIHSPAMIPTTWPRRLNNMDRDIVHLHWINNEMLSIEDIGRLRKPVVWTLHDMWAFCGAEHYTEEFRWREGYTDANRPTYESGFDLNRWSWRRKRRFWQHPMQIVTPGQWLADCVRQSALMKDWPVTVVHNAIDTNIWMPVEKVVARQLLQLPHDVPLLLFGAIGGVTDPRKGFDLLQGALNHLHGQLPGLELLVFGQLAPKSPLDSGFPIHYIGHLHDDISLRLLYSAADVMVVPSRQEAFGQTASEALACGTPVVAYAATGLLDVVQHQQTGYLAKTFDPEDLARGITWTLEDKIRYDKLSRNARRDAVDRFSYPVVAAQYLKVYESVLR